MKRFLLVALAVIVALVAAGCAKVARETGVAAAVAAARPSAAHNGAPDDPALASAVNAFGFDLLGRRDSRSPGAVTVISPLSVHIALGMVANGADGGTLAEVRKVLHTESMSEDETNQAYADLIGRLTSGWGVWLDIANSLWLDDELPVKQAFLAQDSRYFGAEMRTLDLQSPDATTQINSWVKKNTDGKIKQIVTAEDLNQAVLELVNAVYFRAVWETPFEARATRPWPFHLTDGSTTQVDMLVATRPWRHLMDADYEAIAVPYEGDASLVVVKTSPLSSRSAAVPALTAEKFAGLRARLASSTPELGTLRLPKVELQWTGRLEEDLRALSMERLFDAERADLSRMSDAKPIWLGSVIHKTYLSVDERGTEAAAATAAGVWALSATSPQSEPFQMYVDSPYLIAIVDNRSGAILFLASIRDPRGD